MSNSDANLTLPQKRPIEALSINQIAETLINPSKGSMKIARFSDDLKMRAVILHFMYSLSQETVHQLLGPSPRSIRRWYKCFKETGSTDPERKPSEKKVNWAPEVCKFVDTYVKDFPMFYIEELQEALKVRFPDAPSSAATISRGLRFNLMLSRKVMEKRAKEATKEERQVYFNKLKPIYSYPEQLLFLDETSKDGRSSWRRYGWSRRGQKCFTTLPYGR